MRISTHIGALVAAIMIAVTACGSGGDNDPQNGPVSPETEDARNTGGQVTACTVVDRSVAEPLNPNDRDLVSTLLIGDMLFDGCTVGAVYSISFGVRVVEGGERLEDRVELAGPGSLEPIDGLGDQAFRSEATLDGTPDGELVQINIGVRSQGHEIFLRNDSIGNTDPSNRVSEEATIDFLEEFVAAIPDDFESQAQSVLMGEGCVAADDPTVTNVIGDVLIARGSSSGEAGDSLECAYLGEDLDTISTSRSTAENTDDFFDPESTTDEEIAVDGAVRATIYATDDSASLTIQPGEDELAFVTVRKPGVDTAAVVDLTEAFLVEGTPG